MMDFVVRVLPTTTAALPLGLHYKKPMSCLLASPVRLFLARLPHILFRTSFWLPCPGWSSFLLRIGEHHILSVELQYSLTRSKSSSRRFTTMFSKFAVALLLLVPTLSSVVATPVHSGMTNMHLPPISTLTSSPAVRDSNSYSLDSWRGFQSMNGFDDFYGEGNFDGSRNERIFVQQDRIVCRTEEIKIVQQRLVILKEVAKR
jgi:hypothetical protein